MLKRTIRWLLPLIALLMFATYLVIAPIMATHAAPAIPAVPIISAPHGGGGAPNFFHRP